MKTSCEFQFGFWDMTARADAVISASQNQPFADIEDVNLENPDALPNVATLEHNSGWILDGSKSSMPDNAQDYTWGWWSTELSGEDLLFSNPPVLAVSFSDDNGIPTTHSSVGITLTFAANLPGAINIRWYDSSDALIIERDFVPEQLRCFCACAVEAYSKVIITIPSMQYPDRYLRMSSIVFGVLDILDDKRLVKATLTEEADPSGLTLPINRVNLSFYTPDGQFCLLNPTGAYQMFQWGQELVGYKSIDGNRVLLGKYYLQQATGTVDAVTALSCVDIIGLLDEREFMGGVYANTPVATLLDDILASDNVAYALDDTFSGMTITGYLPIASKRSALQQIAFAIGAVVNTSRGDGIRLSPAQTTIARELTPARKITGHKITMEQMVSRVDVTSHRYSLSRPYGNNLKEITCVELEPGEHNITFSAPVSVDYVTGAVLVESHPNYCVVDVSTPSEVSIYGYEYSDTETTHTVQAAQIPPGVRPITKSITTATLIDPAKAPDVAQRVYDYYQLRYTDSGKILPGYEQTGEMVSVAGLGSTSMTGYILQIVTDLAGGGIETIKVRGAADG